MAVANRAVVFVGVPAHQVLSVRTTTESVTRYNELTGEPYQKSVQERTVMLGKCSLGDVTLPKAIKKLEDFMCPLEFFYFDHDCIYDETPVESLKNKDCYVGLKVTQCVEYRNDDVAQAITGTAIEDAKANVITTFMAFDVLPAQPQLMLLLQKHVRV